MTRQMLPDRRESETFETVIRGMNFAISFSRFDDGRVAEVFAWCAAGSSDLSNDLCDASVVASIALQHGAQLADLRKSVLRARNGRPAGVLGEILDEVERRAFIEPNEAAAE